MDGLELYYELPASAAIFVCEAEDCDRQDLSQRSYIDEDGDTYYAVKCSKHWAEESHE